MADVFESIENLAAILDAHGLVAIRLKEGDREIELRRESGGGGAAPAVPLPAAAVGDAIPSPMGGVFYGRPSPDEEPFVQPGDRIAVGQVIGIIEAMKVFNQIESPTAGVLRGVLVEDGQVVQEGDPLFVLEA
ncbi:MAG: biotin/lipoyl-binding protein [Armatimonadota bacterium]|nr:biotin/lipoyl-binding protein [Armatimonadota bacterium]